MKFSLVFDKSGDTITAQAINPEVVEFYIDKLNTLDVNSFSLDNPLQAINVKKTIIDFNETIKRINTWLEPLFDTSLPTYEFDEYLDQRVLNHFHVIWVKSKTLKYDIDKKRFQLDHGLGEHLYRLYPDDIKFPILVDVITKLEKYQEFISLNDPLLHGIESSISYYKFKCCSELNWVDIENPFSKNLVNNTVSNIYLPFQHLGRTLYNKFIFYDHNLEYDDENTFNELLGFVSVNLMPPQTIPYSEEYISWCTKHNREPSGNSLPLGNIPDLFENLTTYRKIFLRNLLNNNKFSLTINKG